MKRNICNRCSFESIVEDEKLKRIEDEDIDDFHSYLDYKSDLLDGSTKN